MRPMNNPASRKSTVIAVLLSVLVIVALVFGFYAGRYWVMDSLSDRVHGFESARTLGALLPDDRLKGIAQAYNDPGAALQRMDDISWAVANIPTPFVGSAPVPGVDGNSTINDQQFRSGASVEMPKPSGEFRIFLTGGSTAFGSGAPDQSQTIGALLENRLSLKSRRDKRTYRVFTFANPAWASTQERISIENRLSELDPDLVISFSGNNDVHWGFRGRNILWFRTYADEHFFSLVQDIYQLTGNGVLKDSVAVSDKPVDCNVVAGRLLKNIELAAFALRRISVPYLFVLQPTIAVTGKDLSDREQEAVAMDSRDYFRNCYTRIDETMQMQTIRELYYVNLSDVFDGLQPRPEIFIDSYHFGDRGNALIAEALGDAVLSVLGRE